MDATPRMKKMLAAGAVLLVFGITVPATATDGTPGKPADGSVGQARFHDSPPGQELGDDNDSNRGYRCDGNQGAGQGNPALGACGGGSTDDGGSGGEYIPDGA